MAEESIILKVGINTENVQKELSAAIKGVADLTEEQKRLTKEIKAGNDADGEQAKRLAVVTSEIEKNKREVKAKTAILQAATAANLKENATLDEQRQALNTLQKAAAAMTEEQRKMMVGEKSLEDTIKDLNDSVTEQEMKLGESGRMVGKYTEAIQKTQKSTKDLSDAFKVTSAGSTQLGKATDSLDKTMKLAASNPWMAVLSLMIPLLRELFKALAGNEEAMAMVKVLMDKLKEAFKQFEPMVKQLAGVFINVLGKAMDVVMAAIQKILKGIDWLAAKFGKNLHLADAFNAGGQAAEEMADAVEESNDRIVKSEQKKNDELAKQREAMARRERTDLENKIHDLEVARDKELQIAGLTADEKIAIEKYYQDEIKKVRDEAAALEQQRADEETKAEEEKARKKLEARQKALEDFGLEDGETMEQKELRLLQEARDQDLLNAEEYELAKTMIQEKYSKKRQADIDNEVSKAQALYEKSVKSATSATSAALSALSDLLGEYADSSEEAADAQKAFAFGAILINQAMSIAEGAKGIAAAMAGAAQAAAATGPAAPFTLIAYQAQMVGQVLAVVASVASTIVQAKQTFAQAEKHKDGALIPGDYDGKDDVPTWLSKGEIVLNPKQATTALWNMANNTMTGYSYENMAAAMANAVAQLPPPNLAITELADVQQRVTTYNEIASV